MLYAYFRFLHLVYLRIDFFQAGIVRRTKILPASCCRNLLQGRLVNFDINFLHADMMRHLGVPLTNDFVDVLRFARRLLPQLPDHKQTTVAGYYGISVTGAHRAHADCLICNACLERLRQRQRDAAP